MEIPYLLPSKEILIEGISNQGIIIDMEIIDNSMVIIKDIRDLLDLEAIVEEEEEEEISNKI